MGFKPSHITYLLYSLLAILAISFLVFEWIQLEDELGIEEIELTATNSVNDSFELLQNQIFEFSSNSTDFVNQVSTILENSASLVNQNDIDENFWGATVFREQHPIYWNGYSITEQLDSVRAINSEFSLRRVREGNVHFLESIIPFTHSNDVDTTFYQVYTRFLLDQQNASNIGRSLNFSINDQIAVNNNFPVRFSYSRVNEDSIFHLREFQSISGDFIASVYALESDVDIFISEKNYRIRKQRSFFIFGIALLLSLLLAWISRKLNSYLLLIIQCSFLWLLYYLHSPVLSYFTIPSWLLTVIDATFLMLAFFAFFHLLRNRLLIKNSSNTSEIYLLSFINGIVISIIWITILSMIYKIVFDSGLNLFNQVLTSSIASSIWLLILGSILLFTASLFNYLSQFILGNKDRTNWSAFVALVAGIVTILIPGIFLSHELNISPTIFWISSIALSAVILLTILQHSFTILSLKVSLLRVFLVLMVFVSASMSATIFYSYSDNLSSRLESKSIEFERDNEEQIQSVITELLNDAHSEVRTISLFSVSNFEQIIDNLIKDEWLKYSFSLQLIDKSGSPLAAYNTNLSVPQWTTDFRIDELIIPYEEERIRRENLRPILRNQPINTVNAEYSYFMRGWIPVYQSRRSENISGWILATLYQEIPELNRPFRSVVNATIQSPEETAFALTEYSDAFPVRSVVSGTLTSIPDYGLLPSSISEKLESRSTFEQSTTIQNIDLKERFNQTERGTVIRAVHQSISLAQLLYVFLRIYFTVAIPLILVLLIVLSTKVFGSFLESRKIKDRLMDRSIIASIVCLLLLIGATSIILESQNEEEVQELLRDQLITLTETLEEATAEDQTSNDFLESITAVLGVDASLYKDGTLVNSTTPPIYSQHLIAPTIPWTSYNKIVENGAQLAIDILQIDDQELMIGYQPWLDESNRIAGIVAIPTFLKTPDFYSRLLTTTSYLLAFYSLIFSVLILSIGWISSRITAPLETLEAGLEKISSGDLSTRLEVQSNDEIGLLTQAYNSMASKLKELQEEVAQSEREAAWKQMAQQVAHEIKNPLTPMKLNLQHLERQLNYTGEQLTLDKPKVASITKSMIEQIEALNKIASDFSKFAKPSTQTFKDVKVNELIQSVVLMYNDSASYLTTEFDSREFIISGVSDELRRVMVNLIKNAQEAIDQKGAITIKTEWNTKNKSVEIKISDDGKGISKEEAASIFLPNFSTKTSGTGLGLAITKKIIEEHSGSISFESVLDKGTVFTISLPLKIT